MQLFSFFNIMIDTRVNSDLAKTKIVTFALKIISSKSVSKTTFTRGKFIRVTDKPYLPVAFNPEK